MLIDCLGGRLLVYLEDSENMITFSENSKFKLSQSFDMEKNCYIMPFAALPAIVKTSKVVGYPLTYSEAFKSFYKNFLTKRRMLEDIKKGVMPDSPEVKDILIFLDDVQKTHKFKYYDQQKESIVFGILGRSICIANEIGTGKTLTAVSIIKYLIMNKKVTKCLIFVPASIVKNFYDDYSHFFGNCDILSVSDQTKETRARIYNNFATNNRIRFLITNYEKCLWDIDYLQMLKPEAVIVDEFHKMRNFISAKRSINFFETIEKIWKPVYRIPMSGTPIENRLFDLFPVFKFVDAGFSVGGQKFFESNFVKYEEKCFMAKGKGGQKYLRREVIAVGFKNEEYLKNLIRPLIIRKKLQLSVGLIKETMTFDMSKKVREKYEEIIFENKEHPSAKYHGIRQFLCDVRRMGLSNSDNPKLEAIKDIIEQTEEKVVIFSFYKCSIRCIEEYLKELKINCLKVTGDETEDPLDVVQRFKDSKDIQVLLATDKINYGHNIQCAKIVIQYELPLKPSTSQQRVGRLYRSGQTKDILSIDFVVNNSIEERIWEMFKEKEKVIKIIENLDKKVTGEEDNEWKSKVNKMIAKELKLNSNTIINFFD